MIKTYVFVSYELAPINPGGCGVFIWNALHELLQDKDNRIILLLDMPNHECQQFIEQFQPTLPNPSGLKVICLQLLLQNVDIPQIEHFQNLFLWKSYQFYKGLLEISNNEMIDYIEFFDYVGIAYFSVRSKKYEGQFSNTILAVRAHCTIDLMDIEQNQLDFKKEKIDMYQMEKDSIRDADKLLVPSEEWGKLYTQRYGANSDKVLVSTPPVRVWDDVNYNFNLSNEDVLFYGRIFQLKGVDLFVDAALSLISYRPFKKIRFILVGYDGLDITGKPYKDQLLRRIPEQLKDRFVFTGQLNRKELEKILQTVRFAVFPNYVESFCYSIHELYNLGVPIICNTIPAFKDFFTHGKNALIFDGTSSDLMRKMIELYDDSNLLKTISKPYSVSRNKQFIDSYKEIFMSDDNSELITVPHHFQVSLIILNDDLTNNYSEATREYLQLPYVDKKTSYLLNKNPIGTPISFLGEMRYVTHLDSTETPELRISNYYLVCYLGDKISPDYFQKAKMIFLRNNSIGYVGSYLNGLEETQTTLQYDLHIRNPYLSYSSLTRCIARRNDNINIRDIYDVRFGAYGECVNLKQEGYVIPEYLVRAVEKKLIINESQRILLSHVETKGKDWQPYVLAPFISSNGDKQHVTSQKVELKRKIYHRLKSRIDGMQGKKGRIAGKLLQAAHRLAKRS